MKFLRITTANYSLWEHQLRNFEKEFTYPLGEDSFSIDHGADYFSFFNRIGNAHLFAAEESGKLVAVGTGVIHHRLKAWYLCDVKVHPSYRGQRIPLRLFRKFFLGCYLKSQRGFALNMESSDGSVNPVRKIMSNLPWTPLKEGSRICFYYEDASVTKQAIQLLGPSRRNIHFSSLKGSKDLVLKSTGNPIPLLHMEWGDEKRGNVLSPQNDQLHMWCLGESDLLNEKLNSIGISPKAKGKIFHHRLNRVNWSDLRTSEL